MNPDDHNRFLAAVDDWEQATQRFGTYRVVSDSMELESLDPNRIWTEGNPGADDEYITNEYLQIEERKFYVFERPYDKSDGELTLFLSLLVDCECQGGDSECESCFGDGTFNLGIPISR